ncbi:TSUP family transporter [Dickeya oryzae]|uniref:TSUP family transporter n=1 Tax=Dickeya oryzae TaxID=1240404 RepID=UPI0031F5D4E3
MPVRLSNLCIGLFFLLLIPLRHLAHRRAITLNDNQLAMAGGVIGFLTGVVFSTGPLTIPLFAGYGLLKGALLATEAVSLVIYLTKASTFGVIGALPWSALLAGVLVGLTQVAGVYIGKRFVLHLSDTLFNRLVDSMMLIAGLSLLWETLPAH